MFRKIATAAVLFLLATGSSRAAGVTCVEPDAITLAIPAHPTAQQLKDAIQDAVYFRAASDYYQHCLSVQFVGETRDAAQAKVALDPAFEVAMKARIDADNALRHKVLDPLQAALVAYKAAHPGDPDLWSQPPLPVQQISCDPFPANYPARPLPDGPQLVNYPPDSVAAAEQGRVLVAFDIGPSGWVLSPRIVKSSGYQRLDNAVLASITSWKFKPILAGGDPITFRDAKYVNFVLPIDASQTAHVQTSESCVFHWPHAPGVLLMPVGPHFAAYPIMARRLSEGGAVYVGITVNPDGSVSNPQLVLTSGVPELDQAALNSALLWLYHPIPKPAQTIVDVRFSIQ